MEHEGPYDPSFHSTPTLKNTRKQKQRDIVSMNPKVN
jgi:hypothetical protein